VSVRSQRYRLDDRGRLFDMETDPGQTTPLNSREPEAAARLAAAVRKWREEMLVSAEPAVNNRNRVDARPIPVGYREFPVTMLPARDGEPHGGVRRSANAPNCSYFVNWTSKADGMVWKLDVHTTGRYDVVIDHTCPEADAGSLVELAFADNRLTGRVAPAWDPPLNTNQDTLPRPHGESQMKDFHALRLGTMKLDSGTGELMLRALEIPGKSVMDVRRVTLTLLPE
jgi:hypothetical protein